MLVAGALSLVVAMGIGRFAYTPILPAMQERFGLTSAAAGALASANYLGYLLGAILAAFVPPGRPQGIMLRASLALAASTTVLVGLSTSFPAWLALRFLAGLASAGVLVFASAAVLGELACRGRPGLSGLFYSGVGLGVALSGLVVLPLNGLLLAGSPAAWRADWLLLGALACALVVPCWAWLPGGLDTSAGEARTAGRSLPAATLPVVLLGFAYLLFGAGYIVTGTFLPAIVEGLPGLGGLGAGVWVLVGLAAAPSTVLWARVASRTGFAAALTLAHAALAVGVALPVLSHGAWAAALSAALFGGTFMGITALALAYARRLAGAARADLALGALTAAFGTGQVLGPLAAASLADAAGNFGTALVAASAVVLAGGVLVAAAGYFGTGVGERASDEHEKGVKG
jgi:predicted MFS family arabinose efflux permease